MAPKRADSPAMAQAAGQVETKHRQIHDLQIRLQKRLPALASRWGASEFNMFQHDYSRFDSEFEQVKQGLDMARASLIDRVEMPTPPARRAHPQACRAHPQTHDPQPQTRRARPETPQHGYPASLPEGITDLTDANAELNTLLMMLRSELSSSMAHWDDAARHVWTTAQTSWDESNRRQQDIVASLPEAMTHIHESGVWFPTTPAAS